MSTSITLKDVIALTTDESVMIVAAPVSRSHGTVGGALEVRKDFLGQQFIRIQRGLPLSPVISHDHETTKSTRLFFQACELGNGIVW